MATYHPTTDGAADRAAFLLGNALLGLGLAKGDRVELIPVKDGVKVIQIKREEIRKIGKRV